MSGEQRAALGATEAPERAATRTVTVPADAWEKLAAKVETTAKALRSGPVHTDYHLLREIVREATDPLAATKESPDAAR